MSGAFSAAQSFVIVPDAAILEYTERVWPHSVRFRSLLREDNVASRQWLTERFGMRGNRLSPPDADQGRMVEFDPSLLWVETGREIRFRQADHALEFKLRWV